MKWTALACDTLVRSCWQCLGPGACAAVLFCGRAPEQFAKTEAPQFGHQDLALFPRGGATDGLPRLLSDVKSKRGARKSWRAVLSLSCSRLPLPPNQARLGSTRTEGAEKDAWQSKTYREGGGEPAPSILAMSPRSVRVKADNIWNDVGKTNDTFGAVGLAGFRPVKLQDMSLSEMFSSSWPSKASKTHTIHAQI